MVENDACLSLLDVAERLRRNVHTPKPPYVGVCGFPVSTGIFLNIQYRCYRITNEQTKEVCGSIRLKVLTILANAQYIHEPTFCLKCGSDNMVFERVDVRTLNDE